jgi:DNA-binding transcriptional MocR family regulator
MGQEDVGIGPTVSTRTEIMLQYDHFNMTEQKYISGDSAVNIATSIETALHDSRLLPGQALPTVRELAATLRVSPTTVAGAYKLLRARGLVSGLGRRGTRIAARPPSPTAARSLVPEGTIDLANGNPDPDLLPSLSQALRAIDVVQRPYDAPSQLPQLAAFAAGEFQADNIPSTHLTIVGGGLDGIERILREHLRPGDRVAVEDPSFPGVLDLIAASGLFPVPYAIDDDGPLADSFEAALSARARAAIVTPRAQNPTGAALTLARARELASALRQHPSVILIEDDHAGPIAGVPAVTLCDGTQTNWAVVRSVSKFLGPDLRVAVVAGDRTTVSRVEGRQALGTRWVSHILQQVVLALWSDPSSARRLARAAETYRHRRETLIRELRARGVSAFGKSGLNVWVPLREEARTVQMLLERGWAVTPGERFRLHTGPGIRVTIAALRAEDAARFADDLADIVQSSGVSRLA